VKVIGTAVIDSGAGVVVVVDGDDDVIGVDSCWVVGMARVVW